MTANDIIERNAECARRLLEAGAEIERLRAERLAFATESEERKADNERLRAALQQIADRYETAGDSWPAYHMRAIARRALEQKP
jgi:predicted RNase H-like nuclease (RuvC/YqgF family)